MRASRLVAAVAILALGVCAAWPFRQASLPAPQAPAPALALDLVPRGQDVLHARGPASELSPAVGLENIGSDFVLPSPLTVRPASATFARPDLAQLAPPPAMPRDFAATDASSAAPPLPPRTYRLRDGDTLEWVAQRFLGGPERAGEIFEANRDTLARPDLLPVGVTIKLPPRKPQTE